MPGMRSFLAYGLFFMAFLPNVGWAEEGMLIVGKGGDHGTIQAAVDHAVPGSTILVRAGTYREHVTIAIALTLRAEGTVVIDAGRTGSAVTISGDGTSFTGFEVRNAGSQKSDAGLFISGNSNTVSHVTATANNFGIVVSGGRDNVITDSEAHDNKHDGIVLQGALSTTVTGNIARDNGRAGIWLAATHVDQVLREAADNKVGNNATRGNRNFGIALNTGANRNTIMGNRVESNGRAMSDAGILLNCGPSGNVIERNTLALNQKHAVLVMSGAVSNRILANAISGSANGIGVYDANANEIVANLVTGAQDYGIRLDDMAPLMGGAGKMPGIAGAFPVSSLNVLYHNDMADNGVNAFDRSGTPWSPPTAPGTPTAQLPAVGQVPAPNRWDNGAEGNHYDDFDEESEGFVDRNADGTGDMPHAIPGGTAVDRFPLARAVGG